MPKRVHQKQKQKQTVVVNIHSTKTKTRTKRKSSKNPAGSQQQINRQQIPPPIHQVYTSPIHNTVPQIFSSTGNRLNIPTLAEQQINNMLNPVSNGISTGNRLNSPPLSSYPSFNTIANSSSSSSSLTDYGPLNSPPLSSYPSFNAVANSLSGSRSLTDYGSLNPPSLNSLAYFKNQHSDSSLGSDVSSSGSDDSSFYNNSQKSNREHRDLLQSVEEHQEFLRQLADDENKLKTQYSEVLNELSSNPIMKEQPENKSLVSSIDSEIEYYAEKPNYDETQSLELNPKLKEQPENQLSLFDRIINTPRVTPFIQKRISDYFNVELPQSNVEQTPIIKPPITSGPVYEISTPFTYKMKKKKQTLK